MFQASSARRAFCEAVSAVNGGSGGRFISGACMPVPKRDRDKSPPGSVSSRLCNKEIMHVSRVSLHSRKCGRRQQLAAGMGRPNMRLSASEKLEIIGLVEQRICRLGER